MVSRWWQRGNRLEHKDAAVRRYALLALSDEQLEANAERISQLARHDPDTDVRTTAIGLLTDGALLCTLLDSDLTRRAAAERTAQLAQTSPDQPGAKHPAVIAIRIENANEQCLPRLLADIDDAEAAAALALRMRHAARDQVLDAPLLKDESGLTVLVKTAKGHDKSLHRYARERLEAIRQARRACEETLARLTDIDDSIARQLSSSGRGHAPLSTAARQKLQRLAAMREECCAALVEQRTALAQAGADGNAYAAPANPLDQVDLSPGAAADDPFAPLVARMQVLARQMRDGAAPEALAEQRNKITDTWLQHADRQPPAAQQHAEFETFSAGYQQYRAAWERMERCRNALARAPVPLGDTVGDTDLKHLAKPRRRWLQRWRDPIAAVSWPEDHTAPAAVEQLHKLLQRVTAELEQLDNRYQTVGDDMQRILRDAQNAVDQGQVQQAIHGLREARELQRAGIHEHDAVIAALSDRVEQLRDWQRFATQPKRDELLQAVRSLADDPHDPPLQAERLRELRRAWRELGPPVGAGEAGMMKEFDALAERAFEPCKAYYAELADQRAANLQERTNICDQLENYLAATDWAEADLQAAETIMRTARETWRQYHPCDHKALKPVQERFEALQAQLHERLKAGWDANAARKQALIAEAQALLEADLDQQIAGAKALQQQWRTIGPVPRKLDQRLWREFRGICDDIFAGRDQAHAAQQAAEQARLESVAAAIEALEQALKDTSSMSRGELRRLQEALRTARGGQRLPAELHRRAQNAADAYERGLQQQAQARAAEELEQWAAWDETVSRSEQTGQTLESPHPAFVNRLAGRATPLDWQQLVIETEIGADVTGPAEEQSRRMEIQIELINSGTRPHDRPVAEICRTWCEAGPKGPELDPLRDRLFAALRKRLG